MYTSLFLRVRAIAFHASLLGRGTVALFGNFCASVRCLLFPTPCVGAICCTPCGICVCHIDLSNRDVTTPDVRHGVHVRASVLFSVIRLCGHVGSTHPAMNMCVLGGLIVLYNARVDALLSFGPSGRHGGSLCSFFAHVTGRYPSTCTRFGGLGAAQILLLTNNIFCAPIDYVRHGEIKVTWR